MKRKTEKDQLFAETQKEFDVKLDRRMKLSDLQDQVERLKAQKILKRDGKDVEVPKSKTPKTVRNIFTGNLFSYDPIWKGNPDLEVVEWEDGDN